MEGLLFASRNDWTSESEMDDIVRQHPKFSLLTSRQQLVIIRDTVYYQDKIIKGKRRGTVSRNCQKRLQEKLLSR